MRQFVLATVFFLLVATSVSAHLFELGDQRIDEFYTKTSLSFIMASFITLSILITIAIIIKDTAHEITKKVIFYSIVGIVTLATAYSALTTISINIISVTKGPVHWHADFEIWHCGTKLNLVDPEGLSNRVGTPVLHEHNDDRIHVEGVVVEYPDVSLHEFFRVIGGTLEADKLVLPTDTGTLTAENGEQCDGTPAELQIFVYKIKNPEEERAWVYEQTKVTDFTEYILSPYSLVPPGDCIIVEFDQEKDRTENICETYRVAEQKGEMRGS